MIVSRAAASITGQHPEKNGVISQVFKVYVSEIFLSSLIALVSISHTRVSSNNRVRRLRVCVCVCAHVYWAIRGSDFALGCGESGGGAVGC